MPEDTNQSTETVDTQEQFNTLDSLWEADEPEQDTNAQECGAQELGQEQQPPEQDAAQAAQQEPAPQTIRVQFNHEERELTLDEARTLAQKGMNYDYVQSQLEALKAQQPLAQLVREMAEAEGIDIATFSQSVRQRMESARIREMEAEGYTPQQAQEIIQARAEAQKYKNELAALQGIAQRQQQQQEQQRALVAFFAKRPDLKPQDVPKEVLEAAARGDSIETAYTMHENARLKAENDALKNNQKVKQAAVTSVQGDGSAAAPDKDDFWTAFMQN